MLAHQGGWDEALYALVPIGLIAVLLWAANRRARKNPPGVSPQSDEHG